MATINATRTTGRVTLTGTTVDTVTLASGPAFDVCNWSGATDLTVTYAVGATAPSNPVAGAAETYAVPAGTSRRVEVPPNSSVDSLRVKVLGNGNIYSVDGAG